MGLVPEETLPCSPDAETAKKPARQLPPAAIRALAEAEARRQVARTDAAPKEWSGRGGAEPVRYGDWEVKGLATDF